MQEFLPNNQRSPESDPSKRGSDGISEDFLYDSEKQLLNSVIDFLPPQMKAFHMLETINKLKDN